MPILISIRRLKDRDQPSRFRRASRACGVLEFPDIAGPVILRERRHPRVHLLLATSKQPGLVAFGAGERAGPGMRIRSPYLVTAAEHRTSEGGSHGQAKRQIIALLAPGETHVTRRDDSGSDV
jgi:hypothetical protein